MAEKKDEIQENFDRLAVKLNLVNQPKSILNEGKLVTEFEANGKKYYIFPPKKVFGIGRQLAYWNIETTFGLGRSLLGIYQFFVDQYQGQLQLMRADSKKEWTELQDKNLRRAINHMDSFKENLTKRFPPALYMCTLFIVTEDEDLAEWDWKLAEAKIDDWLTENLSPFDFFSLALSFSTRSQEIINAIYQTS